MNAHMTERRQMTDNNDQKLKDFIEDAERKLHKLYPGWATKCGHGCNNDTICIPASLDLQKGQFYGPADNKNDNRSAQAKGRVAENTALNSFQKLTGIGGFVISGFHSQHMRKKAAKYHILIRYFDYLDSSMDKNHHNLTTFEADQIFLHPRLGITLLEVKAMEDRANAAHIQKVIQKSISQIVRLQKCISKLMEMACKEEKLANVPICGIICLPNMSKEKLKTSLQLTAQKSTNRYTVLDKSYFDNNDRFKLFWKSKLSEGNVNLLKKIPCYKSLTSLIVGLRSVNDDLSDIRQSHNALQLYKELDEQHAAKEHYKGEMETTRAMSKLQITTLGEQSLYLLPEQIRVLEDESTNILIYGAPGTGKTLLVMLKALQWSRENRAGVVVIIVPEKLLPLYQKFLDDNKSQLTGDGTNRQIILPVEHRPNEAGIIPKHSDFLYDELPVSKHNLLNLNMTHNLFNMNSSGKHLTALSGGKAVWQLHSAAEKVQEIQLRKYCTVYALWTVMRGTNEIVQYWRRQPALNMVVVGHSYCGRAVDCRNMALRNTTAVEKVLLNKVKSLLEEMPPQHTRITIAIICRIDLEAVQLRAYFQSNGISAIGLGGVHVFSNAQRTIIVDTYDACVSYEWPFVIVVGYLFPVSISDSFLTIAASRAICDLTIISRDVSVLAEKMQRKNEKRLKPLRLDFSTLEKRCLAVGLGECNTFARAVNIWYALLSLNLLPTDLSQVEDAALASCTTLGDYLALLATDDTHMHAFWTFGFSLNTKLHLQYIDYNAQIKLTKYLSQLHDSKFQCAMKSFLERLASYQCSVKAAEGGTMPLQPPAVQELRGKLVSCDAWTQCVAPCLWFLVISPTFILTSNVIVSSV